MWLQVLAILLRIISINILKYRFVSKLLRCWTFFLWVSLVIDIQISILLLQSDALCFWAAFASLTVTHIHIYLWYACMYYSHTHTHLHSHTHAHTLQLQLQLVRAKFANWFLMRRLEATPKTPQLPPPSPKCRKSKPYNYKRTCVCVCVFECVCVCVWRGRAVKIMSSIFCARNRKL